MSISIFKSNIQKCFISFGIKLSFLFRLVLYLWYQNLFSNKIKQSKAETDEDKIKFFRTRLHNYGTMVSSINELKHLRGLDSGEKLDPREKIRATAGRVGLSVPRVIILLLPTHIIIWIYFDDRCNPAYQNTLHALLTHSLLYCSSLMKCCPSKRRPLKMLYR